MMVASATATHHTGTTTAGKTRDPTMPASLGTAPQAVALWPIAAVPAASAAAAGRKAEARTG